MKIIIKNFNNSNEKERQKKTGKKLGSTCLTVQSFSIVKVINEINGFTHEQKKKKKKKSTKKK